MQALITGNTYPVKDALKALGAKWDKTAKGWRIDDALQDKARAIVDSAKTSSYPPKHYGSRYGSHYTRFNSGAEVITNNRGRCIDAPCCGCCS